MKLRLALGAAAVAVLGSIGTEAAEPAPPPRLKGQSFDVLYLSATKPVVMRLRIATDGAPLKQAWDGFVSDLFTRFDADKSGSLDDKELTKFRPVFTLLTGQAVPPDAARAPMTREGLAAYLQLNGLGPLRLPPIVTNPQVGQPQFRRGGEPTQEVLDKALMEFLDTNTDGKLSAAELAAGAETLGKLDADENELISADELLRRPVSSPFFVQVYDPSMAVFGSGAELRAFGRKTDPALAKLLLGRYGPKPANPNPQPVMQFQRGFGNGQNAPIVSTARRLTPKDLGLSSGAFAALDQDGDGELDAEELARFGQSAVPEIEVALRLGTLPTGHVPAEVVSGGESLKTSADEHGRDVALEISGVRLELTPAGVSTEAARTAFRSRTLERFRGLDLDGDGHLVPAETTNDLLFRDLFAVLDADGDGKLSEKELVAALDDLNGLVASASRCMVAVDVNETGRGLFGLIDADGDGRFSVRELRTMSRLVKRFDSDKDGFLSPSEVPRRFRAALSRGPTSAGFAPQQVAFNPGGMVATPRTPVGPMWFQKMDRNRDGDVSRREFLGTDEEFRKLDTDGDGLISPQEAEAVGKK